MHIKNKPTTLIQGQHSLFDALADFEANNSQQYQFGDTCSNSSNSDVDEDEREERLQNRLLTKLMRVEDIEQDFSKLHLLVDSLTKTRD